MKERDLIDFISEKVLYPRGGIYVCNALQCWAWFEFFTRGLPWLLKWWVQ